MKTQKSSFIQRGMRLGVGAAALALGTLNPTAHAAVYYRTPLKMISLGNFVVNAFFKILTYSTICSNFSKRISSNLPQINEFLELS